LLSPCPAADDHFSHLEIHARLAVKKFRVSIRLVQTKFKHSTSSKSSRYQNRELAQKPHELHAALGHCAKPCAEIKFDVTEKPSQWKGSWVQGQVLVGEEISFVPQLLCARREKCEKSE
jgi:hypothetical protein